MEDGSRGSGPLAPYSNISHIAQLWGRFGKVKVVPTASANAERLYNIEEEFFVATQLQPGGFNPTVIRKKDITYSSIVAFFAWMFSVYDYILFGTLLPVMAIEFKWTTAYSARIVTFVSVGIFIISLLVGPMIDTLGRKKSMVITTVFAALSSLLTALTFSPIYLVLVRSLSGMGYAEQAVNTTYLSEIYNEKERGFLYSFVQGGWPIGVLFASLMTALTLNSVGWRGVFAIAVFPAVIIVILSFKLKESPRFEAMQHARKLIKAERHAEAKEFGEKYGVAVDKIQKFTFGQLFASDIRRQTISVSLAFLLNWFACQTFLVLGTTILVQGKGITFTNSLFMLVFSNALSYVGYIVLGWIGDRVGRRGTCAVSWLLAGVSYGFMVLWAQSIVAVTITYSLGLFFLIGSYSAFFSYIAESFPTRIRGTASAFVNSMGPLGAIIGSAIFSVIVGATSNNVILGAVASGVVPLLLSGLMILAARKIKPGTSLEDIST